MSQAEYDSLLQVCGDVSRETFDRLKRFEAEFRRWSGRINLAAPSTLEHLWTRHILDSAQLIALAPQARTWLDLGSGGGFPGAVVAILLRERPAARVTLVESNRKKAAFLQSTLGSLGTGARVLPARIEQAAEEMETVDVVTARALAPLPNLLGLSLPWLSRGATGLFHKGRDYRAEVQKSRDLWRFDLVEHRSVVDPESVILDIRNLAIGIRQG